MTRRRDILTGSAFVLLLAGLGVGQLWLERTAAQTKSATVMAPRFEVDPFWPKPLPNHWLLGSTIGVAVDDEDHVWIVHRGGASLNARTEMGAATPRPQKRAAFRRRPSCSSIRPAIWSATGAARPRTTSGRSRTTGLPSTTRATSGSAVTAGPTPTC